MSLPPHEFLTIGEVAAYLRVDTRTIQRWIADHTLPSIRIGTGTTRIRRDDLMRLVAKSRTRKKKGAKLRGTSIDD
jgi:excisionase family DNA binding protein